MYLMALARLTVQFPAKSNRRCRYSRRVNRCCRCSCCSLRVNLFSLQKRLGTRRAKKQKKSFPKILKMGRPKSKQNLGTSLTKRNTKFINNDGVLKNLYEQGDEPKMNENSILDVNDIEDYLHQVELENKEFTTLRTKLRMGLDTNDDIIKQEKQYQSFSGTLKTMPKRPMRTREMSKEQLLQIENDAFLDWRRELATFEHLSMTPFEKNINIWRQLWRVVERSFLVVQIVDARNIEFFRNPELEEWVKELGKHNLLVINKSDLLTRMQRIEWSLYLNSMEIGHCFFSAQPNDDQEEELGGDGRILNPQELLDYLSSECPTSDGRKPIIGFVGYPNVGKSSTINALIGQQSVRVGSTPGKTKHFQTIHLEQFILCDCPGLVFPKVVNTNSVCILNGVFPIDQLRDPIPPTNLLCEKIPRAHFEHLYHIQIYCRDEEGRLVDRPCNGSELLTCFARQRGYTKSSQGNPDESKAARLILKDYVKGKLCFVEPPPGIESATFNTQLYRESSSLDKEGQVSTFDEQFFNEEVVRVKTVDDDDFARVIYPHKKSMVMGDKKHKKERRKKTRDYWTATI